MSYEALSLHSNLCYSTGLLMWHSIAVLAQAVCYATWIHNALLRGAHLLKSASASEAPSAEKSEFGPMLLSVDDASLLVSSKSLSPKAAVCVE